MIKSSILERSWLPRGCSGFADTLSQFPGDDEQQKFLLHSWLPRWQALLKPSATPGGAFLNWLLPQKAHAAWLEGKVHPPEPGLLHSWTAPLAYRQNTELVKYCLAQGNFSPATQVHQPMEARPMRGDLDPFYQDRQGLSHLEEGQLEAAHAKFQELAQNKDPFWQHLARVRLADMELSRLQVELAP